MSEIFEQNIIFAPVCFVEDLTIEGAQDSHRCHICGRLVLEFSACCKCGLTSCLDCLTVRDGITLCLEHQETR